MKQVVIVDDDVDFAEILKETLEEDGDVNVLSVVHNDQHARQFFAQHDLNKVDCALVDLVLPLTPDAAEANSMNGLGIVHHLRHDCDFAGLIIVLTNSRLLEDGQRALDAGCDGYLCKYAHPTQVPALVGELKLALKGSVVLVSRQMRHVFIRDGLTAKEARLMELLDQGCSWSQIAAQLGYKTPKAAATIGYRVFDKILSPAEGAVDSENGEFKRYKALQRWRTRYRPVPQPNYSVVSVS